ncbi:MAG: hypothetical protein ACTSW1_10015 [Candidatus Hodarchaeales archaeon]
MDPPEEGSDEHIAGFIMNKLYSHGCWQKRGKRPRKHHSITDIKKGYPKHFRGKFEKIINNLKKDDLLVIFSHGGDREHHICAILERDALVRGIELANQFRMSEILPLWDDELEEIL